VNENEIEFEKVEQYFPALLLERKATLTSVCHVVSQWCTIFHISSRNTSSLLSFIGQL
jgi:hypothetical protein